VNWQSIQSAIDDQWDRDYRGLHEALIGSWSAATLPLSSLSMSQWSESGYVGVFDLSGNGAEWADYGFRYRK
jgi:hypothetical protein